MNKTKTINLWKVNGEYNGWINYYTWAMYLHITSYEHIYKNYRRLAKNQTKKDFIRQICLDIEKDQVIDFEDLDQLEKEAVCTAINFDELYNAIKEEN